MNKRRSALFTAAAAAALVLSACGGSAGSTNTSSSAGNPASIPATSTSSTVPSAETSAALRTAQSSLGTIVVDAQGKTVYVFDKDTANSGKSACAGACLTAWPPVPAPDTTPTATGVAGTVGSIATASGTRQLTLNGLPLYYYKDDSAGGDVHGQGVGGIWWVVGADGAKMTASASSGGY